MRIISKYRFNPAFQVENYSSYYLTCRALNSRFRSFRSYERVWISNGDIYNPIEECNEDLKR